MLSLLMFNICAVSSFAQSAAQNPLAPLPKKPSDLIELAVQKNGLRDANLEPWHIQVTWQTVNAQGQPTKTGTWDEWRASKSQFRETYQTAGFNQTYWMTDHGSFLTGDPGWPAWIFTELENIYTPFPPVISHQNFVRNWVKTGQSKLQCLSAGDLQPGNSTTYCFDTTSPAIRIQIDPPVEVVVDSYGSFQGQFIPTHLRLFRVGLPDTTIRVDAVGKLLPAEMVVFAPPSNAVPADPREMTEADGLMPGGLIRVGDFPSPTDAKGKDIRTAIIGLDIVIANDGTASRIEVIGATPGLDPQPYLDFFQKARYHPSTWKGRPIAIRNTTVLTFKPH